jgi:dolichyl-phosphate-mannose-protein mannosyltransferase
MQVKQRTKKKEELTTPTSSPDRTKFPKEVSAEPEKAKSNRKSPKEVSKEPEKRQFSRDYKYQILVIISTILAIIVRGYAIHHPGEVVFDEVHFGKFASFYLRGEYYFDVHPPLGKMLLALVGYSVGYDGSFLFEKIGLNYADHSVPYVAMRLWCALCGAGVVPFAILIMKEVGVSVVGASLGACLLIFDTALTTQSRLILLDSMLMLFCTMTIYFWVKFQSHRHESFTPVWWLWLSMTGVGLALILGVKLVGLFTVASVGIATIYDLWILLDIKKGHSMVF